MFLHGTNIRTEPKFIIFLTQLLALFKFCPSCKSENPHVEVQENGTMAEVSMTCSNLECRKSTTWHSQPMIPGTRIPAGNFLQCFSILLAGASATKVFRVLRHMGVKCISLTTFFKHQQVSRNLAVEVSTYTIYFLYPLIFSQEKLFPAILLHWKKYQSKLIQQMKNTRELIVAGDERQTAWGTMQNIVPIPYFAARCHLLFILP